MHDEPTPIADPKDETQAEPIDPTEETPPEANGFAKLGLPKRILDALIPLGYEQPSPIQEKSIPILLEGKDLLGVAQTGTGKTAAFAMPILAQLNPEATKPQALVLVPTRELAIQVSEAFKRYATQMPGFRVAPIYGGSEYGAQLRQLNRGVHVVIGTPGRVMDHLRRGTLKLDILKTLVLDEADEMLRMGFLDDVEWILQHIPATRQTALFSATMPVPIRKVAATYLQDPQEVRIASKTATLQNVTQQACRVHANDKLDALTRLLETRDTDAMLIFVRTKTATVELADRIEARGFACEALNGDMSQKIRERTIDRLRSNKLDILIATDVAARGIDVPRISHVINFDIPYDPETYIHRIGRTGRAGRSGAAITLVTPREYRLLNIIERHTRQKIEWMAIPGRKQIADRRVNLFKQQMQDILQGGENLDFFRELIQSFAEEQECTTEDAAASLAYLLQRERPLQPPPDTIQPPRAPRSYVERDKKRPEEHRGRRERPDTTGYIRYKIQVGREHGVHPAHIVGAIANEVGLESQHIGSIRLFDKHSTIELPPGMPKDVFAHLKKVRILQHPMQIEPMDAVAAGSDYRGRRPHSPGGRGGFGGKSESGPPRKGKKLKGSDKGKPKLKGKGKEKVRTKDKGKPKRKDRSGAKGDGSKPPKRKDKD